MSDKQHPWISEAQHPALIEFDEAMRTPRARLGSLAAEVARLTRQSKDLQLWLDTANDINNAAQTKLVELEADKHALQTALGNLEADKHALQTALYNVEAELAEARKQPVQVLPEITPELWSEVRNEWNKPQYGVEIEDTVRAVNTVFARRFRQADPPETIAALVARVQRETRQECVEYARRRAETAELLGNDMAANALKGFAASMERGE